MRHFKFGWYGDNDLGEHLIGLILAGDKTATVCPSYDPQDADVEAGEKMLLVDKHDNPRGLLRVVSVETRLLSEVDAALARRVGTTFEDLMGRLSFANGREVKPSEEIRVTLFELLSDKPPLFRKG